MDGGKGLNPTPKDYPLAGGAGGVIQIIAPEGDIAADTLSLKRGENGNIHCCVTAEDGYFLLKGKSRNT